MLAIFSTLGTYFSAKFEINPGFVAPVSGLLFTLTGAMVVALSLKDWRPSVLLLSICSASEVLGLFTGFPFGKYSYTERWWPTISLSDSHFFPLQLPFAWLMLVGCCYLVSRSFLCKKRAVLLSALLTTIIDVPLERAMTKVFGYWVWIDKGFLFDAPIQNSLGWFAVSLAVSLVLMAFDRDIDVRHAGGVVGMFCFFVAFTGILKFNDIAWTILFVISAFFLVADVAAKPTKPRE